MTATLSPSSLDFQLSPELEAHEPPEVRGAGRDDVRLMVSVGASTPVHTRFRQLPEFLSPGDLVVVNRSGTVAAALDAWNERVDSIVVHLATPLPDGTWLVEPRRPHGPATAPFGEDVSGQTLSMAGGGRARVLHPFGDSNRLFVVALDVEGDVVDYLARHGHPIRYAHVPRPWPLDAYQTVFATEPGSAEMPSAGRPFTGALVAELVARGVGVVPLVLHTGVSSLEGHEMPYPERYEVPAATAAAVNSTRAAGGRVVAVGTTVVRALETTADADGWVEPGAGWTELVLGPERPTRAVDGLVTGWHEPRSSHLSLLEALAPIAVLETAYAAAVRAGYRWHEFGDLHVILP